jgi:hypothetical protein
MADSTTPFGTIASGQGNQSSKANALFDAASPVAIYGYKYATTSGLTLGYHGGKITVNGVVTTIADGTLVMTASSTNYVEANPVTGAVSKNTTSYTPGHWRIGRAVTGTGSITTWYDDRYLCFGQQTRLQTKAFPSDANYTLTQPEADVDVISITAGTISTTRDFIVPIAFPKVWTVINKTAQSVRIIGASGTGITIATVKTATVMADGTNVIRLTADV